MNKNKNIIIHLSYLTIFALLFNLFGGYVNALTRQIIRVIYVLSTLYLLQKLKIGLQDHQTIIEKYQSQLKDKTFVIGFIINLGFFSVIYISSLGKVTLENIASLLYVFYDGFLLAACWEEITIRGMYFDELKTRYPVFICVFLCGFIFSALHIPQELFQYKLELTSVLFGILTGTLKGMLLCLINMFTKNIFITALVHFNTGPFGNINGFIVSIPILLPYLFKLSNQLFNEKIITPEK